MAKEITVTMDTPEIKNPMTDGIIDPSLKKVPKIEVEKVKSWYGEFQAIKGINMTIKPNTVTAFIGPS
jgi:phosphate transport system ATP-binding protein